MTIGIRKPWHAAFALSALLLACTKPPDQQQIAAVDQLIAATEAASLTMNELSRARYAEADSQRAADSALYAARFAEALRPQEARALGNQWVALNGAHAMARDHERVLIELIATAERLRALRHDIATGAFDREQAAPLIATEQERHAQVIGGVHAVIDNYRLLQQAWDRRDTVAMCLAHSPTP